MCDMDRDGSEGTSAVGPVPIFSDADTALICAEPSLNGAPLSAGTLVDIIADSLVTCFFFRPPGPSGSTAIDPYLQEKNGSPSLDKTPNLSPPD